MNSRKNRYGSAVRCAAHPFADLIGEQVKRRDGEGVGIERGQGGHRQIHAPHYRQQRGRDHLQRTGNQAAKQADGHPARNRATMQVPQVGVMQPVPQWMQPAVLQNTFAARQMIAKKFTHDGIVMVG